MRKFFLLSMALCLFSGVCMASVATYDCVMSTYGTGSSDGTNKTDGAINATGDVSCGWAVFDTSSDPIPGGSTFVSCNFNFYCSANSWPYWGVGDMTVDPLTATASEIWNDAYGDQTYGYWTESGDIPTGWGFRGLSGPIWTDLMAAMGGNFSIGIYESDSGSSFYIILDGWNSNSPYLEVNYLVPGEQTPTPCPGCPAGGIVNAEPTCFTDYNDTLNGGCNASPPVFETYNCGDLICGTLGDYTFGTFSYRDMDWFRLDLSGESDYTDVTYTFNYDGDSQGMWLMDAGSENCADYTTIQFNSSSGSTCPQWLSVNGFVAPAVYWLVVGDLWTGVPCGAEYTGEITCIMGAPSPTPCAACPPGGIVNAEPTCFTDYNDTTNGGCNASPPVFEDVAICDVICGTGGDYTFGTFSYRDMDWFRLDLTGAGGNTDVSWTVINEGSSLAIWLMDAGSENCADYSTIQFLSANTACTPLTVSGSALPPAVYWLIEGDLWTNVDCGTAYVGEVGVCLVTPTPTVGGPTPTPPPVPTTGPMGLGIVVLVISGLLGFSALRRRK
jgi:hypothetical protein